MKNFKFKRIRTILVEVEDEIHVEEHDYLLALEKLKTSIRNNSVQISDSIINFETSKDVSKKYYYAENPVFVEAIS